MSGKRTLSPALGRRINMRKLILVLLIVLCSGCVAVKHGGTFYVRFWNQEIGSAYIETQNGDKVVLERQKSENDALLELFKALVAPRGTSYTFDEWTDSR
jgi:hypothetical protein